MRPINRNERGMTLVEILAVVVIGAIIMVFVTSILTQSVNEQKRQTTNNKEITEMRYVLKLITKDMRKSTSFVKNGNETKFSTPANPNIATYKFDEANHLITRNDVVIASNIDIFSPLPIPAGVEIEIKSLNRKPIKTELYFRSGN